MGKLGCNCGATMSDTGCSPINIDHKMNRNTIFADFMAIFPELYDEVNQHMQANNISDNDGMHVKFGMAIVPVIINHATDAPIIDKMCNFFEKMATCTDTNVQELLDFTILESLIENKTIITDMKRHMRKETLLHCQEVEKLMT